MIFRAILRREIYRGLTGFTFRFSLSVLTVLVPLSAYTQALYYKQFVADYSVRLNTHENENNYRSAVVTRPVPALLSFFNGAYYNLPNEIVLRGGSKVNVPSSDDLEPLDQSFPKADLSLLVGMLMTLMAVLLGYDTITEEREKGTLRLMLSFPVKKRTILAAKLGSLTLVMCFSLIYTMALYVLAVKVWGSGTFYLTAERLSELLIVFLISLLNLIVFVAIGVAASILAKHLARALAISAIAWVILLFVWPSVVSYAVYAVWPVPPNQFAQYQLLAKEKELIQAEMTDHRELAAQFKAQNTGREIAWQKYQELNRYWAEKKREELGQLTKTRERQIRKQQTAATYLSMLSPYGAFFHAMSSVCGTGLADYNSFVASVAAYEENEFAPASTEAMAKQKPWAADAETETLKIRAFQMPEPTLSERLMLAAPAIIALIIQSQVLLAFCFIKFNRYPLV